MAEFWIAIPESPLQQNKINALKKKMQNIDAILISGGDAEIGNLLNAKTVVAKEDSDVILVDRFHQIQSTIQKGQTVAFLMTIKNREDEKQAADAAKMGVKYLVVDCPDWKIIPLENLIAKLRGTETKLIASVKTAEEAKTAIETLEIGADGILLNNIDDEEMALTAALIKKSGHRVEMVEAKIVDKKALSLGARVCIDTCNIMKRGEGLLVGSQSSGLFLVQAEVIVNPHVEPRPFRVNAGPISSYILKPDGSTQYLSELKAGDEVLIVNRKGETSIGNIGRVKIEMRPQILLETEYQDKIFKVVLQNAETIHLVTKDGSKSITDLKPSDKVLIRYEEGGRHFGMLVPEEMVIER
ncbi:3-dehydroquinate synthase II [[Eubacterium] cellulosolvens]